MHTLQVSMQNVKAALHSFLEESLKSEGKSQTIDVASFPSTDNLVPPPSPSRQYHMQTLAIYKLGFNQNYYTFTLISLMKIVLCSKFP